MCFGAHAGLVALDQEDSPRQCEVGNAFFSFKVACFDRHVYVGVFVGPAEAVADSVAASFLALEFKCWGVVGDADAVIVVVVDRKKYGVTVCACETERTCIPSSTAQQNAVAMLSGRSAW